MVIQTELARLPPAAYLELRYGYALAAKRTGCAAKLRQQIEQRPVAATPVEVMASAARNMSAAMQTTLTLVEQIHHKTTHQPERRIPKQRRLEDGALDD